MDLNDAIRLFPAQSPVAAILRQLLSSAEEEQDAGRKALTNLTPPPYQDANPIPEAEARALLLVATQMRFPPKARPWDIAGPDLVSALWRSPHASLVQPAREAYDVAEDAMRLALLTFIASTGTRAAAEAVIACLRQHGWPKQTYPRLFDELSKLLPQSEVLFPALVSLAGPRLTEVGDLLLQALRGDHIDRTTLEGWDVTWLLARLRRRLEQAREQGAPDPSSEDDGMLRAELGMLLDLAGFLGRIDDVRDDLRAASNLFDPRLVAFAVAALLRRKESVPDSRLEYAAASHETRVVLHSLLESLGALDRFPPKYNTRDAFAATDMVTWLSYPSELGQPPDSLECMAKFVAKEEGRDVVLFVWRFRVANEPWKAGVSGTYPLDAPVGPAYGESTFSRFDNWNEADAEGHAEEILQTLTEWRQQLA